MIRYRHQTRDLKCNVIKMKKGVRKRGNFALSQKFLLSIFASTLTHLFRVFHFEMAHDKRGRCQQIGCQCLEYAFWLAPPEGVSPRACECCQHHANYHTISEGSSLSENYTALPLTNSLYNGSNDTVG